MGSMDLCISTRSYNPGTALGKSYGGNGWCRVAYVKPPHRDPPRLSNRERLGKSSESHLRY